MTAISDPASGLEFAGANASHLLRSMVRRLSLLCLVLLLGWLLVGVEYPSALMAVVVVVGGTGLVGAYWLASRNPRLAAGAVVALSSLGITALAGATLAPAGWSFLVIPLLLAGLLTGALASLLLLPVLIAVVAVVSPLAGPELRLVCFILVATGTLVASCAQLFTGELHSSWLINASASNLQRQLSNRRAELASAIKTLELTNHLLQKTNLELEMGRREADEARQLKAQFAASISHELRTPLSVILGFTEIMTRTPEVYGDISPFRKLARDIGELRRAARYLSGLVDDILDLARIDALKMPIRREQVHIQEVVEEAVGTVRGMLESGPVSLSASVAAGIPPLSLDRVRIGQVLLNLLTNAARFTAQGSIAMSVTLADGDVLVSVRDTGPGIPPQELDRIFDEFYQLETGSGHGGKGLGLAISRRIIQLHDGRIWCESEVGKGTTFHFTLPLVPRHTSRLVRRSEAGLPHDPFPPAVVVLDEGPLASSYLHRHLEEYEVRWASSVEQVLAHLDECRPHAVVVNSALAAGPVFEELRQRLPPGLPLVCLALPSAKWLGQDSRFDACMVKPVSPFDLAALAAKLAPQGPYLIVDDDRGFVALLRRTLEEVIPAEDIHCAYSAAEALELVRSFEPALVFVDIVMPETDGFALADCIRERQRVVKPHLVAVTGTSLGEDALSMRGEEFTIRLARGFRGEELASLLKATLSSVRASYV